MNAASTVRRDPAAVHAIDHHVSEGLKKRHLDRRLLKLGSLVSQTLRKIIRKIRDGAEAEYVEANDELQRRPVGASRTHSRQDPELNQVQVSEMHHGAHGGRNERATSLQENA